MTTPPVARSAAPSSSATLAPPIAPPLESPISSSDRESSSDAATPGQAGAAHSTALRFLQRFALIALGLYHVPLFLNNYPSLGGGGFNDTGLAPRWGHVFTVPGIWVARHVFGMSGPMTQASTGDNGDVGEEFARLLIAVVIGVIVAAVWTVRDRDRPRGGWVPEVTRVLLRYSIALGLTSYAIAKLLPTQFPPLSPLALERRVGELTPMALLWQFMEYSRPYAFFGGLMEMVVVLLLCFRRTATLGAVLCLAVMSNVAAMNWAYDVPVKLYSTMTVVTAAVIVLYDIPRLFPIFLTGRSAPPPVHSFIHDRVSVRTRWLLKTVALGSVVLSSLAVMIGSVRSDATPHGAANGAWDVTSLSRGGQLVDPIADRTAWRRVLIDAYSVSVRAATDSIFSCGRSGSGDTLTMSCGKRKGELRSRRDGDVLHLDGTFDGAPISVTGRLVKRTDYRLLRSKLHIFTDR